MAAIVTDNKISVNVVLDNGSGNTISLPLGSLNKSSFNADKVMAIVNTLTPCLDKTFVRVEKITASTITSGD